MFFEDQPRLFLSDRDPNRIRQDANTLKLSSIFKCYREGFEKGWRGFNTLEDFQLAHFDALQLTPTMAKNLKSRSVDIDCLDYDWQLNARP
jgi:hypothetical protein